MHTIMTAAPPPPTTAAAATATTRKRPQWREAVAGATAGALSRTLLAPVERVKLLKQLQGSSGGGGSGSGGVPLFESLQGVPRPSAWQVARAVRAEQGLRAFWQGNVPSVLRVSGTAAVNFCCMDYYKRVLLDNAGGCHPVVAPRSSATVAAANNNNATQQQQEQQQEWEERQRQLTASFVSGGLAGATATTLLYPVEFVRTRLAMDVGASVSGSSTSKTATRTTDLQPPRRRPRQYAGMRDVVAKIVRSDGVRGLFQGYGIALAGGIFYRVLLLGGYDATKAEVRLWRHRQQQEQQQERMQQQEQQTTTTSTAAAGTATTAVIELTWLERIVSAQCISLTAGTLSYPLDSVRRRMMMQAGVAREDRRFRSSLHCIATVWRHEGVRGFFLGLGPNLVRSVSGALLLVGYDRVRTLL